MIASVLCLSGVRKRQSAIGIPCCPGLAGSTSFPHSITPSSLRAGRSTASGIRGDPATSAVAAGWPASGEAACWSVPFCPPCPQFFLAVGGPNSARTGGHFQPESVANFAGIRNERQRVNFSERRHGRRHAAGCPESPLRALSRKSAALYRPASIGFSGRNPPEYARSSDLVEGSNRFVHDAPPCPGLPRHSDNRFARRKQRASGPFAANLPTDDFAIGGDCWRQHLVSDH